MTGSAIPIGLVRIIAKKAQDCKEVIKAVDAKNGELTRDRLVECFMTDLDMMRLTIGMEHEILGNIPNMEEDDGFKEQMKEVVSSFWTKPASSS